MSHRDLPLEGLRVLEFTHAVMGPAAGLILADLGAEVIRIEPAPQGDHTRRLKGFGQGFYTFFNRNKKSLAADIKSEEGRQIVKKLLTSADVLIENFGPGTMERLGFGYETLSEANPRLIYCSLKGFMQGPYEHRVALDEVVQMMSGLAYMTGPPGQPLRAGTSIVDIMGGTFGALAVLVALKQREETGRGSHVLNGLFETAAFVMGQHMSYAAMTQAPVPPMPARVSAWSIYQLFRTKDDQQVFIGVTSDRHWERFCDIFDRADLFADESLATNNGRIAARERLLPDLEAMFAGMTFDEIARRCEQAELPFSHVARPEDLFSDPQLVEGDSLVAARLANGRTAMLPRVPLSLDGERFDLRSEAPGLGEHTLPLLSDLGYSRERIRSLHDAEVVVAVFDGED